MLWATRYDYYRPTKPHLKVVDIMDIIYILIPLSILIIGIAVGVLFWAIKSGQFDDMDSPAHRILFDDDDHIQK